MNIIRPIIRPIISTIISPPSGGLEFNAVNSASNSFNEDGTDYVAHTWTAVGTFTTNQTLEIEYEVIGQGGGGGTTQFSTPAGGGGGAGGRVTGTITLSPGTYKCQPGTTGGQGGAEATDSNGVNGQSSFLRYNNDEIIAEAFGGSGGGSPGPTPAGLGASGGGGGASVTLRPGATGGIQGNDGGDSFPSATTSERASGGGGGITSAGTDATAGVRGMGGAGVSSAINGTSVTVCAGGDGKARPSGVDIITEGNATGFGCGGHGRGSAGTSSGSQGRVVVRYQST